MPEAAITTDIIVGFPGETEEDFLATMEVVRRARFSAAFTFQYSIRPGTPAATLPDQVPKAVTQERYERLVALVNELAWEENKAFAGRDVEVMFATGEGRKDAETNRMSGRARDNRLVHVAVPTDPALRPRPGDIATVRITHAAPHHLNSDEQPRGLRRTRGGDAWEAATTGPRPAGVGLGMPVVGKPAPVEASAGCP
jgi:tRNA-2-methylthio-N6-dimethylallyladenosine synthase